MATNKKNNKANKASNDKANKANSDKAAAAEAIRKLASAKAADDEDETDSEELADDDEESSAASSATGSKRRNKIVASAAVLAKRVQKVAGLLVGSPLAAKAQELADGWTELAAACDDLPDNFTPMSTNNRGFVPGARVTISDRFKARFEDVLDLTKPIIVIKQVGHRVLVEDASKCRTLVGGFNLKNL